MSKSTFKNASRVAQFIDRRIAELRPRLSQIEIAAAAGFQSPNMLSMIKDGKAKLPLDRVAAMAKALECDPAQLMRLAMEQFFDQSLIDLMTGSNDGSRSKGKDCDESSTHDLEVVATWAVALEVEAQLATHDAKLAKRFAASSKVWAERAEARAALMLKELGELVEAARTPGGLLRVAKGQPPQG